MEEKLLKFRKEREKQKFKEELKEKTEKIRTQVISLPNKLLSAFQKKIEIDDHTNDTKSADGSDCESEPEEEDTYTDYAKCFLLFIIWLSLYLFFIHIEFGAVYFCVTALMFIYYNTRTGRRKKNEVSAYSVFNQNCENIEGTFTADQIDKQIRSGML